MSDEPEANPLRLKRSTTSSQPSLPPETTTKEQPEEASSSPDRVRKRPSIGIDSTPKATPATDSAEKKTDPIAPSQDSAATPPAPSLKLRVGARPPAPVDPVNTPPPFDPATLPASVAATAPTQPEPDVVGTHSAPPLVPLPSLVPTAGNPSVNRPEVPAMGFGGSTLTPLSPLSPPSGLKPLAPLSTPSGLPVKPGLAASPATPLATPVVKAHHPRRDLLIFILLLVLLSAAAFWGYQKIYGSAETADAAASPAVSAPVATPPTPPPPAPAGQPAISPGAVVMDVGGTALTSEPVAGSATVAAGEDEIPPAAPSATTAYEAEAPQQVPAPQPSVRFRRYIETLRVSGVFQGATPRALINGRVVRVGEVLDAAAGIRFVGLDTTTRELILQETGGALLRAKY